MNHFLVLQIQTLGKCLVVALRQVQCIIVQEYCSKSVNGLTVTTLPGLLLQLGNSLRIEFRFFALIDKSKGIPYFHHQNIAHVNTKPQNILVCGVTDDKFVFKITDYACNGIPGASHLLPKSASFKQLITTGYLAPEFEMKIFQYSRQHNLTYIPLLF